jgi:hypothetical protein
MEKKRAVDEERPTKKPRFIEPAAASFDDINDDCLLLTLSCDNIYV